MPQTSLDAQYVAQIKLSTYIQHQAKTAAYYEIDADSDPDFGTLYRVWGGSKRIHLLGTFYQNLAGYWISQPCHTHSAQLATKDQAIEAILND